MNMTWFTERRNIWGNSVLLREPVEWPQSVGDAGTQLIWCFLEEIGSRILTQPLASRSGDEATALTSVYGLFEFTRTQGREHGIEARDASRILWWLLNRDVRPFTSAWHRVSVRGGLSREDTCRRFRRDLEHLRVSLRAWEAALCGLIDETVDAPVLPAKRDDFDLRIPRDLCRTSPCSEEWLSVPLRPDVRGQFKQLVEAESKMVSDWRGRTKRKEGAPLTGIALSGGGIRSATFALGVLRALAERFPVLSVDYLSTVSGGGYLGSLISTAYERELHDSETCGPLKGEYGRAVVGWLRGRSMTMAYDVQMIADAAPEYRRRLASTWLINRRTPAETEDQAGGESEEGTAREPVVLCTGTDLNLHEMKKPAPLHIWNLAVNATELDDWTKIALRGRGADLYAVSRLGAECRLNGYAEAKWKMSEAMALSGAASAPTTSATSTTGWRSRLGKALAPNLGADVDHESGQVSSPSWARSLKLRLGFADVEESTVFLSDGGHVENTGVYQLLRRQCAFILAIDGEQDAEMTFHGLAELQHLARVELDTELAIDTTDLELVDGLSATHFIAIPIRYPNDPENEKPERRGVMIYVKLSLTGDEPMYIKRFKAEHPEFPHHSTVKKQAYDDRTFEAYLALGRHVGMQLVSEDWLGGAGVSETDFFEDWAQRLAERLGETGLRQRYFG